MQLRRFRPGDVVDDYCPRERRVTNHAIVAMIDDHIKQTRCAVCDAEHEYKDGKVPPRRKKPQAALFTQVLDGLQGPQPAARATHQDAYLAQNDQLVQEGHSPHLPEPLMLTATNPVPHRAALTVAPVAAVAELDDEAVGDDDLPLRDEGPVRRQLIRAALPRPEGQPPQPTRTMPEFTIRQPSSNRGPRQGRRRGGGPQAQGSTQGPMRSGRGSQGPTHGQGNGGPRQNGSRNQGRRGGKPR